MNELKLVDQYEFVVGRHTLRKHFGLKKNVSVLSQARGSFGKQLVLRESSDLSSGRVPLYLCPCGDLGCGALTVSIERRGEVVRWADFGWESNLEEGFSQDDVLARFGPCEFEWSVYCYTLSPFT